MNNFAEKNKSKVGDYYLGLDVGTGSVGWAVTDKNYDLVKINGKTLWGSRLFETAKTAAERRLHRNERRRTMRRSQRIDLLQGLFDEEIVKVDPGFFQRLNDSNLHKDDKSEVQIYSLFNDRNFNDRNYADEYPTIHHLRKQLMSSAATDIRLLYLAIHNIIKKRGHFLYENFNVENSQAGFSEIWQSCCSLYVDAILPNDERNITNDDQLTEKNVALKNMLYDLEKSFLNVLMKSDDKKKDLEILLKDVLNDCPELKKQILKFRDMLCGYTVSIAEMFPVSEDLVEELNKNKISFKSADFDEKLLALPEEYQEIINSISAVYNFARLQLVLNGKKSISEVKVKIYEDFAKDLHTLKNFIKSKMTDSMMSEVLNYNIIDENGNSKKDGAIEKEHNIFFIKNFSFEECKKNFYKELFKEPKNKNVKKDDRSFFYNISHGQRDTALTKDLYKILKRLCGYIEGNNCCELNDDEQELIGKILNDTIFTKSVSIDNSVIPYQLNLYELNLILENSRANFSFLGKTDENGISVVDKIKSILTFRIPYYVGPLNQHSKFSWIVKRSNEKITPWNFEKVVDKSASAQRFIERMTSKCTYLKNEDVLPDNSILYSKFRVLNELNNLRINGCRLENIEKGLVLDIYNNVYLNKSKVTIKHITKYLENKNYASEFVITGIDEELKSAMSSYVKIKAALSKVDIPEDKLEDVMENIILWLTVYGNEHEIIEERILNDYKDLFATHQDVVKRIAKLKFSGWGSLSKKLLSGVFGKLTESENQDQSIIDLMMHGKGNLNELLSNKYTFSQKIKNININAGIINSTFSYEALVQDLYVSPSVKRMIWQTLLVVNELEKIMGYPAKRIMIEMARGASENDTKPGNKTVSRKNKLLNLYKSCQKDQAFLRVDELQNRLSNETDSRLRSDRLYLYYTQMGKCMYTGESIDLAELNNQDLYDIDHIYPQSLTKDDSFDNRVLVTRKSNASKGATYPLSAQIREKQHYFWKSLKDKNLISSIKFERLVRSTELTSEELASFISRQLVETRQSTKVTAHLLEDLYPQTEIIFSKASNVADFKNFFGLIKVRELNNLHHAKDAYCNIVVGNVFYEKFSKDPYYILNSKKQEKYTFSVGSKSYMFVNEYDFRLQERGVWDARAQKSLKTVIKNYSKNNIFLTVQQEVTSGALFDATRYSAKPALMPLKKGLNTDLYGGFKSVSTAFFSLIKYTKKKKECIQVTPIPIYISNKDGDLIENINNYLIDECELSNPKILISCLKMPMCFRINNTDFEFLCNGYSGKQLACKQNNSLILPPNYAFILKKIIAFNSKCINDKNYIYNVRIDKFCENDLTALFEIFKSKMENSVFKYAPLAVYGVIKDKSLDDINYKSLVTNKNYIEHERIVNKIKILLEILIFFQSNGATSDMRLLGGASQAGKFMLNATFNTDKVDYLIVNKSITGFYKEEIRINDL